METLEAIAELFNLYFEDLKWLVVGFELIESEAVDECLIIDQFDQMDFVEDWLLQVMVSGYFDFIESIVPGKIKL